MKRQGNAKADPSHQDQNELWLFRPILDVQKEGEEEWEARSAWAYCAGPENQGLRAVSRNTPESGVRRCSPCSPQSRFPRDVPSGEFDISMSLATQICITLFDARLILDRAWIARDVAKPDKTEVRSNCPDNAVRGCSVRVLEKRILSHHSNV
jgi:hypothetical protein